MEFTINDLKDLLRQWQALAKEMQARGEAFGDDYAYGVLYGMQVCQADLERAIQRLSQRALVPQTNRHMQVYTWLPESRRNSLPRD